MCDRIITVRVISNQFQDIKLKKKRAYWLMWTVSIVLPLNRRELDNPCANSHPTSKSRWVHISVGEIEFRGSKYFEYFYQYCNTLWTHVKTFGLLERYRMQFLKSPSRVEC